MDFPRLMFSAPGPEQCQGGSYAHKLVHSVEEFEGHQEQGWHNTLPEALDPMPQWLRRQQQDDAQRDADRLAEEEANKASAERTAKERAEQDMADAERQRLAAEELQRIEAKHQEEADAARLEAARLEAEKKADEQPPTSAELRAKAKELGLVFKRNATDEEIGNLIAAKLAEV